MSQRAVVTSLDLNLLVIGGKGGVGRTTAAAAVALAAARRGRRVLLAQTRAKERLSRIFGVAPIGPDVVRVRDKLFAVNIEPQAALREYGTMVLRSAMVSKAVLENRISHAFLRAVPGLEDYAMLGKIWYHTTPEAGADRFDLVVVDGPATGHLIHMLRLPQAILDAVPSGPLTQSAESARALIRDPRRTAMAIVTLAEDLPANEALDLARRATELVGIPLGPLLVNALYPPRFALGPSARALQLLPEAIEPPLGPLLAAARLTQRRRALNDRQLERLKAELLLPQIQLPFLFVPEIGPAAIEDLAQRIEGQLAQIPIPVRRTTST